MKTQNLKFTFHVIDKGDSSVGIPPTYEKVSIDCEYGFYDEFTESEFEKAMKEFLHDFYAECKCLVLNDEEFKKLEGELFEELIFEQGLEEERSC